MSTQVDIIFPATTNGSSNLATNVDVTGTISSGVRASVTFVNSSSFSVNSGSTAFPNALLASTPSQSSINGSVGTASSSTNIVWRTDLPGTQNPTDLFDLCFERFER